MTRDVKEAIIAACNQIGSGGKGTGGLQDYPAGCRTTWCFWESTTSFAKDSAMLIIMTRWHVDHLLGWYIERFKDVKVLRYGDSGEAGQLSQGRGGAVPRAEATELSARSQAGADRGLVAVDLSAAPYRGGRWHLPGARKGEAAGIWGVRREGYDNRSKARNCRIARHFRSGFQ
jgi:hypothetical protein